MTARLLWEEKTGSSPAATQEAREPPCSIRSHEPPRSTVSSPRHTCATSSPASARTRSTASTRCCRGTGHHWRRKASPPEQTAVKQKMP